MKSRYLNIGAILLFIPLFFSLANNPNHSTITPPQKTNTPPPPTNLNSAITQPQVTNLNSLSKPQDTLSSKTTNHTGLTLPIGSSFQMNPIVQYRTDGVPYSFKHGIHSSNVISMVDAHNDVVNITNTENYSLSVIDQTGTSINYISLYDSVFQRSGKDIINFGSYVPSSDGQYIYLSVIYHDQHPDNLSGSLHSSMFKWNILSNNVTKIVDFGKNSQKNCFDDVIFNFEVIPNKGHDQLLIFNMHVNDYYWKNPDIPNDHVGVVSDSDYSSNQYVIIDPNITYKKDEVNSGPTKSINRISNELLYGVKNPKDTQTLNVVKSFSYGINLSNGFITKLEDGYSMTFDAHVIGIREKDNDGGTITYSNKWGNHNQYNQAPTKYHCGDMLQRVFYFDVNNGEIIPNESKNTISNSKNSAGNSSQILPVQIGNAYTWDSFLNDVMYMAYDPFTYMFSQQKHFISAPQTTYKTDPNTTTRGNFYTSDITNVGDNQIIKNTPKIIPKHSDYISQIDLGGVDSKLLFELSSDSKGLANSTQLFVYDTSKRNPNWVTLFDTKNLTINNISYKSPFDGDVITGFGWLDTNKTKMSIYDSIGNIYEYDVLTNGISLLKGVLVATTPSQVGAQIIPSDLKTNTNSNAIMKRLYLSKGFSQNNIKTTYIDTHTQKDDTSGYATFKTTLSSDGYYYDFTNQIEGFLNLSPYNEIAFEIAFAADDKIKNKNILPSEITVEDVIFDKYIYSSNDPSSAPLALNYGTIKLSPDDANGRLKISFTIDQKTDSKNAFFNTALDNMKNSYSITYTGFNQIGISDLMWIYIGSGIGAMVLLIIALIGSIYAFKWHDKRYGRQEWREKLFPAEIDPVELEYLKKHNLEIPLFDSRPFNQRFKSLLSKQDVTKEEILLNEARVENKKNHKLIPKFTTRVKSNLDTDEVAEIDPSINAVEEVNDNITNSNNVGLTDDSKHSYHSNSSNHGESNHNKPDFTMHINKDHKNEGDAFDKSNLTENQPKIINEATKPLIDKPKNVIGASNHIADNKQNTFVFNDLPKKIILNKLPTQKLPLTHTSNAEPVINKDVSPKKSFHHFRKATPLKDDNNFNQTHILRQKQNIQQQDKTVSNSNPQRVMKTTPIIQSKNIVSHPQRVMNHSSIPQRENLNTITQQQRIIDSSRQHPIPNRSTQQLPINGRNIQQPHNINMQQQNNAPNQQPLVNNQNSQRSRSNNYNNQQRYNNAPNQQPLVNNQNAQRSRSNNYNNQQPQNVNSQQRYNNAPNQQPLVNNQNAQRSRSNNYSNQQPHNVNSQQRYNNAPNQQPLVNNQNTQSSRSNNYSNQQQSTNNTTQFRRPMQQATNRVNERREGRNDSVSRGSKSRSRR